MVLLFINFHVKEFKAFMEMKLDYIFVDEVSMLHRSRASRRDRGRRTLAPPHTRTEVAVLPHVLMGEKSRSLRIASAPTEGE
jgi:hypothetical protein